MMHLLLGAAAILGGLSWVLSFDNDEFFTAIGWVYVFTGCLIIASVPYFQMS